jgi:hypothetical protein
MRKMGLITKSILIALCVCLPAMLITCKPVIPPQDAALSPETRAAEKRARELVDELNENRKKTGVSFHYAPKEKHPASLYAQMRKDAAQLVATEEDAQAIVCHGKGKIDEGLALIATSLKERPKRPLPYFLRACLLFDKGDFQTAKVAADEAYALCPKSGASFLIGAMAEKLVGNTDPAPSKLLAAYDHAWMLLVQTTSLNYPTRDFFAYGPTPLVRFDPPAHRMLTLGHRFVESRKETILREYETKVSLQRAIILLRGLEPRTAYPMLKELAKRHPKMEELQVALICGRISEAGVMVFGRYRSYGSDNEARDAWANYRERIHALRIRNPANGFLHLLEIDLDQKNRNKPLTPAEVSSLERAVEATHFDSHTEYLRDEVLQEHFQHLGPQLKVGTGMWGSSQPIGYALVRVAATRLESLKKGDLAKARNMQHLGNRLAKRALAGNTRYMTKAVVLHALESHISMIQEELAQRGLSDRSKACMEQRAAAFRRKEEVSFLLRNIAPLRDLPIIRARHLIAQVFDSSALAEERVTRMKRLFRSEILKKAATHLQGEMHNVLRKDGDNHHHCYKSINRLTMFPDPKSIPLLEKVATSTDPFAVYLAKQAIAEIEKAQAAKMIR